MSDDSDHISGINYELLIDDSMRNVLRGALTIAEHVGLPGESHFFISFRTDFEGVEVNPALLKKGENELTIVIQHQFWDLKVEDTFFQVTLSFSNKPETLVIPFASVTHFSDPSVGFGLQFGIYEEADNSEDDQQTNLLEVSDAPKDSIHAVEPKDTAALESDDSAEIVSLDSFRNRTDKS